MEIVLAKDSNIQDNVKLIGLESKISEYENNHNNGMGKYFTLDEVNEIIEKTIKTGRQVA